MSEASALAEASAVGRVARIQQIGQDAGHRAFSAVDLSQVSTDSRIMMIDLQR
jgi:hypothetical protein